MRTFNKETITENKKYLTLLSKQFSGIQKTTAEIINLNAILNLPKGTEHFISDIHGEHEAFDHVLRNCSGSIRKKIEENFSNEMNESEIREILSVIYYPHEKIKYLKKNLKIEEGKNLSYEWYEDTIKKLIAICKMSSGKYSHSKIRKTAPKNYAYIIQELLFRSDVNGDRAEYYEQIIKSIIDTDAATDFIASISKMIRRMNLDHLHIVGDIYDRGEGPHFVMDTLMKYHTLDIQWGNHDILWMGAAAGNAACVANAVRISMRYGNTGILEDGYGINLVPLSVFAMETYKDDDSLAKFMPKIGYEIPDIDDLLLAKMQKAMAIIQFKLESYLINRHPDYEMDDRKIIDTINLEKNTVMVDGEEYELNTKFFPTIDANAPYELTKEERKIITGLVNSFSISEKLQKHMNFILRKGSIYKVYNENLLIHACVPVEEDLSFKKVKINNKVLSGRKYLDYLDERVRFAYYSEETAEKDIFWFLWCAAQSPLFGKHKMATFERYFIDDKLTHKEKFIPYYVNIENPTMADKIFAEFGITSENAHIICGHIPVKANKGENAVKADGKIICIDAGFAKAYQKETGMAGCTLTYNSYGMNLIIHEPFVSLEKTITDGIDIKSQTRFVNEVTHRKMVADTETGKELREQIYYLEMLLYAYKTGEITPRE